MPAFGTRSRTNLNQCHPDLIALFQVVVKHIDCSVICGHRSEADQDAAFNSGASQLKYPLSKHNQMPSNAADVVPYPVDWDDIDRFKEFGFFVLGVAAALKEAGIISHDIRWGADWNKNYDVEDERFRDFPHFEIVK